jgi:hypothetical protein
MGWERAKESIECLIRDGFIQPAASHTKGKPRYEIASFDEYLTKDNPSFKPGRYDLALLSEIQSGKQPIGKRKSSRAESLEDEGWLWRDLNREFRLPADIPQDSTCYYIWLPNTIVTGTSRGEESPLHRLRATGRWELLSLFVDLYAAQNLRDDGGISPQVMAQPFERRELGRQRGYTVWGFKPTEILCRWGAPFEAAIWHLGTKAERSQRFHNSIDLLKRLGLLSFVPHIFENRGYAAEPIHPFGVGGIGEVPIEDEIGDAAFDAACSLTSLRDRKEAELAGFKYFCPISNTKPFAQMLGIARLTYRPHTRRTGAWMAKLQESGPALIESFNELVSKAQATAIDKRLGLLKTA